MNGKINELTSALPPRLANAFTKEELQIKPVGYSIDDCKPDNELKSIDDILEKLYAIFCDIINHVFTLRESIVDQNVAKYSAETLLEKAKDTVKYLDTINIVCSIKDINERISDIDETCEEARKKLNKADAKLNKDEPAEKERNDEAHVAYFEMSTIVKRIHSIIDPIIENRET
ncbi:hypothetical protein AGMMS49944_29450 [Spirochaetia bacterium]|nr:hypothetical protein AGMMS49944_29450 [Spirochaetia bacterium]